jgi:hypothetical protein
MSKIATSDQNALNTLMRGELTKMGSKTAAEDKSLQAFKDHEEMISTLESVLKEDGTESFDPNDMILD